MADFLGFLGAFIYGVPQGKSLEPYRRYACYSCTHDGFFPVRDIPPQCERAGCRGIRDGWWEVVKCPACHKDLYYPAGEVLDEPCKANNGIHDPDPVAVGRPPRCR